MVGKIIGGDYLKFKLGTCLLLITSLLFVGKYISAAILVNGMDFPNNELLEQTLKSFPSKYNFSMLLTLISGLILVALGLIFEKDNQN